MKPSRWLFRSQPWGQACKCLVLLVVLAFCGHCKPSSGAARDGGSGAAVVAPAVSALDRAYPNGQPVLTGLSALEQLPADTWGVAAVDSLQGMVDRLGRERLVHTFRQYYEMAVAEITQVVGHNLLDVKNLKAVGIDPLQPVGAALLVQGEEPVGVLFARLSDAETFKTTLYRVSGQNRARLTALAEGSALILYPEQDEEVCVVVREPWVYLVIADHDKDGMAVARAIATTAKKDSLAAVPEIQKNLTQLAFGRQAAGYVRMAPMLALIRAEKVRFEQTYRAQNDASINERIDTLRRQVEQARQNGSPPEAIAAMEAALREAQTQYDNDRQWQDRNLQRHMAEYRLIDGLLGALQDVAFGVELAGQAVKVKAQVGVQPDSLLAKLLANDHGIAPLLTAQAVAPTYLTQVHGDVPAFRQVFEWLLAADGTPFEEFQSKFLEATQLDFDRDVLAALTGTIGVAVTADIKQAVRNDDDMAAAMGGSLVVGVKDAAQGKALLGRIAQIPALVMLQMQRSTDGARLTLPIPGWKPLYISLVGTSLLASTDAEFDRRLAEGNVQASFMAKTPNAAFKQLLQTPDAAAVWGLDWGILGYLFLSRTYSAAIDRIDVPSPGSGKSPRLLAKKSELETVTQQLQTLQSQRDRQEFEVMQAMLQRIGMLACHIRVRPGSLTLYGGQFIQDESIAALIEHLISDGLRMEKESSEYYRKTGELNNRRWQIEEELRKIAADDAARAMQEQQVIPPPGPTNSPGVLQVIPVPPVAPAPVPPAPVPPANSGSSPLIHHPSVIRDPVPQSMR